MPSSWSNVLLAGAAALVAALAWGMVLALLVA